MTEAHRHEGQSRVVTEAEELADQLRHFSDELDRLATEVSQAARARAEREAAPDA
jgi:hypothetical protein